MNALPAALARQRARILISRGFDPQAELKALQRRMAMVFRARHGGTGPEIAANHLNLARNIRAVIRDAQ